MRKIVGGASVLVVAAALLLLAHPVASQDGTNITDLGPLAGVGSPTDINSNGQLVGWHGSLDHFLWTPERGWESLPGPGLTSVYINDARQVATTVYSGTINTKAILWDGGEVTTLGDLGSGYTVARAMNEAGHVVGQSYTGEVQYHAFLWTPQAGIQDLGTPGGDYSKGVAINNLDWVAGDGRTATGETHAFLWTSSDGMTDLGTLGATYSSAYDVNDAGQVVGVSDVAPGQSHAFLWTGDDGMIDLGTLGGTWSIARDINEAGEVAGSSSMADGSEHAFLWTPDGGLQDLGGLGGVGSRAVRVTNSGQVVGRAWLASGEYRGFVWTEATGMLELVPLPGGTYSDAVDLNENGQAVGWSNTDTGERHAVVWTVVVPSPEEQIQGLLGSLSQLVNDGSLKQGNANALTQKLENALGQLQADKTGPACAQLQAFVNQVEAYTKNGNLPAEDGAALIEAVNIVIGEVCG
jgi:probable HAF family extracellular repeat protein